MAPLRSDRSQPIRNHLALLVTAACFGAAIGAAPAWSNAPALARVDASLARALEGPFPATGIAIGVTLREKDLPKDRTSRMAAVNARQQSVLAALPAGAFQPTRRYRSVAGFAGTANANAIEALARNPFVETIYLDGVVHAALVQGVSLIGADVVHAQGFTGVGVKVAVLDTGVDTNHPDIIDDLVAQQCFCDTHPSPQVGGCCPGGAGQGSNAEDDEGHGTAVSGIITSGGVNAGLGVAPDAEIVAVKVLSNTGSGTFTDIAAALDWVLTEAANGTSPAFGTRVVNMSLSDGGEYDNAAASPCTGTNTANAINALHAAGITVFAASGNDAHTAGISFPACVANAISVGGVYDASLGGVAWGGTANCTDFSTAPNMFVCHANSGSLLDLLAPNYRTTTSKIGGGVVDFGGTSASSPYAAGQAALLLDANAALAPEDIRTHMTANGTSVTNSANGLSFPRTDIDLAVAAVVPPPSEVFVVDNGDAGYSTNGSWTTYNGAGAQGDFDYKLVGSGAEDATWTLTGLTPGEYSVSVTWEAYTNRASDAPYTVVDGVSALELGTVAVDQRQTPVGFVEDGVAWQDLGSFQISGNSVVVRLSDAANPAGSYVIADAVRIERIGDFVPGPEIRVHVGGTEIPDGTGSVDLGSTVVGAPLSQSISVQNVGSADLTLGVITLPSGFSLLADFGTTLLAPAQTTDFVVQLDAAVEAVFAGTISFDSNDADENPYEFDVSGTVAAAIPSICGNFSTESGEDCDDGNTENGDCCSSSCIFEISGSFCDDTDACTDGDTCDGAGTCDSGTALVCDDGLYCNGLESCDSGSGCVAGTAPPTDDGVACTDDSCNELDDVVVNSPNAAACDDADECTADACDAVSGCTHEPIPFCGAPIAATSDGWLGVLATALFAGGAVALARRRPRRGRP